ncbi:MAG: hypothetical protein HY926_08290 [Elusimicrobia bacterium]|nr:hypothetical protein [Elusimicrobiota bacterium]
MKPLKIPVAALCAAFLAVGAGYLCWRAVRGDDAGLRDSLNAGMTLPAGDVHARLAASAAQTCVLCHQARSASAVQPLWGGGGSWAADGAQAYSAPESGVCLSCHDGSLAGNSGSYVDVEGSRYVPGRPMDFRAGHPVGVQYLAAYMTRTDAFHHPSEPGVRLENGKVGCISCHSIHSPPEPGARQGIIESACVSCHIR